jgi:hypothetical protein
MERIAAAAFLEALIAAVHYKIHTVLTNQQWRPVYLPAATDDPDIVTNR